MKKKLLAIGLLTSILTACGSTSEQASAPKSSNEVKYQKAVTSSDAEKTEQEVAKADDIVCTYQQKTGSRFKKKICLPRAVRDQLREQAQTLLRTKSGSRLPADQKY